jgi:hypothetical protein
MEPVPRPPWHFDVTCLLFEVVYALEREKCSMNNLNLSPLLFFKDNKKFQFFLMLTPCVKHNFLARQWILQHKSEKKKKCDYVIILSFFLIFFPSFISREY